MSAGIGGEGELDFFFGAEIPTKIWRERHPHTRKALESLESSKES